MAILLLRLHWLIRGLKYSRMGAYSDQNRRYARSAVWMSAAGAAG